MKHKPLVSILIPTYNRADYILDAVQSALAQTYTNIEVVVHDAASTDNTLTLLKAIDDPRLRIIHTTKNRGMIHAWNYVLKRAKGTWIKHLASDDLLDPTCIAKQIEATLKNPRASLITCKRRFIDSNNKTIRELGFSSKNSTINGLEHAHWILTTIRENKIGEPTATLFRRDHALEVGEFDNSFSQFADFEFWIRVLSKGDLVYLNETLCSFRIHDTSNTTQAIQDGRFITEIFALISKYYDSKKYTQLFQLTDSERASLIRLKTLDTLKNIKELLLAGRIIQAMRYYLRLSREVSILQVIRLLSS